jgi:thiol:disulfide interchange protein DsbD
MTIAEAAQKFMETGPILGICLAFFFGVLASISPCVYPIIPITVSFVGANARGSKLRGFYLSLFYVIGMALVYAALGMFAALTGGFVGQLMNNGWVLLIIANIFLLIGLSLLGVFEIPIPRFLQQRSSNTKVEGMWSALIVGVVSGFIVGPCTGPVLAAILTLIAKSQFNPIYGAIIMFAFSLGMGALLIVCGTFVGFITGLPKPGVWMERVKKSFGIIMILVAEFFIIYLGQNANFPEIVDWLSY